MHIAANAVGRGGIGVVREDGIEATLQEARQHVILADQGRLGEVRRAQPVFSHSFNFLPFFRSPQAQPHESV